MTDSDADTRNLPVDDGVKRNRSDSDVVEDDDLQILPPNRVGATIAVIRGNPAAETSHAEELQVPMQAFNYCTASRWKYRWELWKQYMDNPSAQLPTLEAFLFSKVPEENTNSVEYVIWGSGEDSLKSLHTTLEADQSELAALQKDVSKQIGLSSLEDSIVSTDADEPKTSEDLAHLKLNNEQLAYIKDSMIKKDQALKRAERARIEAKRARIKAERVRIVEPIVAERAHIIERIEGKRAAILAIVKLINCQLKGISRLHVDLQKVLSLLAERGNETAASTVSSASLDKRRFDKISDPEQNIVHQIRSTKGDENFLKELLGKPEIIEQKDNLCELQTYVSALLKKAVLVKKMKVGVDKRIKASVNAILQWEPGTTVESLRQSKEKFGRPPPKGCETSADQPILCALIVRILTLLGQDFTSLSNEQVVAPVGDQGRFRRMDFIVDEYREFLHVQFPEKLGREIAVKTTGIPVNPAAIQVKPVSKENYNEFKKNQANAREQVIGHLVKQLLCVSDFGGIGKDDIVCGVVLSMVSIQVVEMQLTKIGTDEADVVFRQTPHVPLFGGIHVPYDDKPKLPELHWDMESNGVLLLASAMLDIPRRSLFGNDSEKIKIDDESAKTYYSLSSNIKESEKHIGIEIQSYLGCGSFAHVVKLGDNMFMKIPRSECMVKSLRREFEILELLQPLQPQGQTCIPRVMPWGVSLVNLSIRSEISPMNVLRLEGIVGCSLSNYCKYMPFEKNDDCHRVIKKVYNALDFAHSKNVYHMDVRPSNIIVRSKGKGKGKGEENEDEFDVLLTNWGCSMLHNETIDEGRFVGCPPYAHDELLGKRETRQLRPKPAFDFASLGYTWYHVAKRIEWHFDWPTEVTPEQLKDRQKKMEEFFGNTLDAATAFSVPKVHGMFVPKRKKRTFMCCLKKW